MSDIHLTIEESHAEPAVDTLSWQLRYLTFIRSCLASTGFHLLLFALVALLFVKSEPRQVKVISLGSSIDGEDRPVSDVVFEAIPLPARFGDDSSRPDLPDADVPSPGTPSLATVEEASRSAGARNAPAGEVSQLFLRDGNLAATLDELRGSAEFFGIKSVGQRFVFLLDRSLSMRGVKWYVAKRELLATVGELQPHQTFYVILFDLDSHPMFGDGQIMAGPVPATSHYVHQLRLWLDEVQFGYETEPWPAFYTALQYEPDAIFLLSDGVFSDLTLNQLRLINRSVAPDGSLLDAPRVAVHTVAVQDRTGTRALRTLSKENAGEHRFVSISKDDWELYAQRQLHRADDDAIGALQRLGGAVHRDEQGNVKRVSYAGDDRGIEPIMQLPFVRELLLPHSYVTDRGLRKLKEYSELELLVLSHTSISDEGATYLAKMRDLQGLFLEGTKITDRGMQDLARLRDLRVLSTPGQLSNAAMTSVADLRKLEILYLVEPAIDDQGIARLADLYSLRQLHVQDSQLTDAGLESLQRLTNLEVLDLSGTRVSGPGLASLKRLTKLRALWLADTDVDSAGFAQLPWLPALETLHLEATKVDDRVVDRLLELPSLKFVAVDLSESALERLRELRPDLVVEGPQSLESRVEGRELGKGERP
jgi:hypothetical protein